MMTQHVSINIDLSKVFGTREEAWYSFVPGPTASWLIERHREVSDPGPRWVHGPGYSLGIQVDNISGEVAVGDGLAMRVHSASLTVFWYSLNADQQSFSYLGHSQETGERKKFLDAYVGSASLDREAAAVQLLKLAQCYKRGTGCEVDLKMAFKAYSVSARFNNTTAINRVGLCYLMGIGTNIDADLAVQCFFLSGRNGDPNALCNLGICHLKGIGTLTNERKALTCFKRAAAKGHGQAIYLLGVCGLNGIGMPPHRPTVIGLFLLAEKRGSKKARRLLRGCVIGPDLWDGMPQRLRWLIQNTKSI